MPEKQMSYAEIFRERMKTDRNPQKHPITIRQASAATGYSYEHIRKVITGVPVMSRDMNDRLCDLLGLDKDDMWNLAQQEKVRAKYGENIHTLSAPDASLRKLWVKLSKNDQERVALFIRALADASEMTSVFNRA